MAKAPYIPPLLPPRLDYNRLIKKIAYANKSVGELEGLLSTLPNVGLLVAPILTSEALASSKIEGTEATIEEVFKQQAMDPDSQKTPKERDIKEVINYRNAIDVAEKELKDNPIVESLLKRLHDVLLDSARGANKERGRLRSIQVYIGKQNERNIDNASYVPPPVTELPRLLSNWENYVNNDSEPDDIVKIAVAHYQFEAIHPFRDGNGRIGRLLIPLLLFKTGHLSYPILYISDFFEKNRDAYIDHLQGVDRNQKWTEWVGFFLDSIATQAVSTQTTIYKMFIARGEARNKIQTMNSKYGIRLLDLIFTHPIVSATFIKKEMGISSYQTVLNLLDRFERDKILVEITGGKRNKVYAFRDLINILRSPD